MLTADDVLTAVRVHADRLHDAVRRLGCNPVAAAHVVETASMELVEAVARGRFDVDEPVGWLFARARVLGQAAAGGDDTLPVGGGVLGGDATQVRLAEALEARPERERAALLLRDSYDLPMPTVATALGLELTAATEAVGHARLALLPGLTGTGAPQVPDHVPLASLTRVAEGGQQAARETTSRRHTESCDRCASVVDGQERARRMLAALTVVALPDEEREQLLARVEARARAVLPAAAPGAEEWEEEHRRYSLSLMALGLVVALGAGIGIGVLTSRGGNGKQAAGTGPVSLVSAAPVLTVQPVQLGTPPPTGPPTPRVFFITPSPTPEPTLTATPTPTSTETALAQLQLDPSSGPRDSQVTVTGSGWSPATQVVVEYLNFGSATPGYTASVVTDASGTFTTTIVAHDSSLANPQAPHTVRADDGSHQAQATFTAT